MPQLLWSKRNPVIASIMKIQLLIVLISSKSLYFDEKLQDFAQFKIMLSLIAARTPGSRKNSAENEVYSFLIKRYRESYESPSKFFMVFTVIYLL